MTKDNVVYLNMPTKIDIPIERVAQGAIDNGLKVLVVCGIDKDGDFYFASSTADLDAVLMLLERAKRRCIDMADE